MFSRGFWGLPARGLGEQGTEASGFPRKGGAGVSTGLYAYGEERPPSPPEEGFVDLTGERIPRRDGLAAPEGWAWHPMRDGCACLYCSLFVPRTEVGSSRESMRRHTEKHLETRRHHRMMRNAELAGKVFPGKERGAMDLHRLRREAVPILVDLVNLRNAVLGDGPICDGSGQVDTSAGAELRAFRNIANRAHNLIDEEHAKTDGSPIRPIGDRLLVKKVPPKGRHGKIVIPDSAKKDTLQGIVAAVGPGYHHEQLGARIPIELAVGDRVFFTEFCGVAYKEDGEEFLLLREGDVMAVLAEDADPKPSGRESRDGEW